MKREKLKIVFFCCVCNCEINEDWTSSEAKLSNVISPRQCRLILAYYASTVYSDFHSVYGCYILEKTQQITLLMGSLCKSHNTVLYKEKIYRKYKLRMGHNCELNMFLPRNWFIFFCKRINKLLTDPPNKFLVGFSCSRCHFLIGKFQ